jgi:hypothetical protein
MLYIQDEWMVIMDDASVEPPECTLRHYLLYLCVYINIPSRRSGACLQIWILSSLSLDSNLNSLGPCCSVSHTDGASVGQHGGAFRVQNLKEGAPPSGEMGDEAGRPEIGRP